MSSAKPLGMKSYGSIPHLPGSRTGPADHSVNDGQARIFTEAIKPGSKARIVVQEKLDGSNCSVALVGGKVLALGRAGYLASTSKYEMHQMFAEWVSERETDFYNLLSEGERVCGEWLVQAHGTIYAPILEPMLFRPFDIMRGATDRLDYETVAYRCGFNGLCPVTTIHEGIPISVLTALVLLERDPCCLPTADGSLREGCVWREERQRKDGSWYVNGLAKYVRPEKVDGKYLDGDPVWMVAR